MPSLPRRIAAILHVITLLFGILAACLPAAGRADDLHVMAANAVRESLQELVTQFERRSGHRVMLTWGGTDAIARRVSAGEACDLVIIAAPSVDELRREGRVAADGRLDFARSGIGVAVRSGLPRPGIASEEELRQAVLASRSIAYSSGPSGRHVSALLERLGILEQVRGRITQPPSGVQVGDLLLRGEADLGFQQESELIHVKGIDYLGPLPRSLQTYTVYAIGLSASSRAPETARLLARELTSPPAAAAIQRSGMNPP